jgi:hypothetical protein
VLKKFDIPLAQATTYYESLRIGDHPKVELSQKELRELNQAAHEYILSKVCTINPESFLTWDTGGSAIGFAMSPIKAMEKLRELEPNGFDERNSVPTFKDAKFNFLAKNVCSAMNVEGSRT